MTINYNRRIPSYETMSDNTGKRLTTLDMYKGLAIFGVLVTHIVLLQNGADGTSEQTNPIVQFMFAGLVVFFLISGYLYKPGKSYMQNVKHRVVPLVIIYVVFSIAATVIAYLYLLCLGYDLSSYDLVGVIEKTLVGKGVFMEIGSPEFKASNVILAPFDVNVQTYYLSLLFLGYLIFYAIVDRVIDSWKKTVVTIIILFAITSVYLEVVRIQLPLLLQLAPLSAGFLLTGALLSRYNFVQFLDEGLRDKRFWIGLAVAIILSVVFLMLFPAPPSFKHSDLGNYGYFSGLTFALTNLSCGILQMFLISILVKVPVLSHAFIHMGKNSLYLYLYHMLVAKILVAPFVQLTAEYYIPLPFLPAFAVTLVTIVIILIAAHFYHKFKEERLSGKPLRPLATSV